MLHRISLRRRSSLRMASTRTHHHSLLRWITGSGLLKPERAVLVSEGNYDWSDTGAGLLAGTLVTFRGSLRFPAISLRLLKSCRIQASRINSASPYKVKKFPCNWIDDARQMLHIQMWLRW